MKKIKMTICTALATALLATSCSNSDQATTTDNNTDSSSSAEATVLKVAFNQSETHPEYIALSELSDRISERTEGRYVLEIYPNELLGAQKETIELAQDGTIAMSVVGGSLMENFNPDFVVFNLPYVFDSTEHQMSVVNNQEIVSDLYSSTEEQGIKVLGAFHVGARSVYTKKGPVQTPEDLAGQKIRVMQSDTNIEMMKLMGGTGTPMGQGEVYTAIQSGVLDGGENNELIYNDLKHLEVAPYFSYTRHLMMPDYLIINADIYNGMSEEDKTVFTEELQVAIDQEVKLFEENVATATTAAIEAGAQFNEVDIESFRSSVAPLIESSLKNDVTKQIYQKVNESR